ncbi:MAG: GNAT family N-acetyltransferase [Minwuia sp.]|uniref:bifunctional helix-turn-helix transcriptional regulator/GNAT family N-acetyltransferase n=1 Tax=Minwuia sp. TaxID=2493630 RepID=UPI003A89A001
MDHTIAEVRDFTRFYTRRLGVLKEGLLDTDLPLPLARIVFELAQTSSLTGGALSKDLALDPAYVSRLIKQLERRGLIAKRASETDGREKLIELTEAGRACFADLDARSRAEVAGLLQDLAPAEHAELTAAMGRVRGLLERGDDGRQPPFILRPHRPGDIGWVISRHGALYAEEYGWDITFEAMVAEIAGRFITEFQPGWEHCWIAERHGQNVGSVFVVKESDEVAKLRMLIVEPSARGLKIGETLVDTVIGFARAKGYRMLTLWTNDCLHAARRIYQKKGFVLVEEEKHHSFGVDLVGQNWDLTL